MLRSGLKRRFWRGANGGGCLFDVDELATLQDQTAALAQLGQELLVFRRTEVCVGSAGDVGVVNRARGRADPSPRLDDMRAWFFGSLERQFERAFLFACFV